ncbi:hypothetical protein QBC35DRAFT_456523 [Podospora australis]|uniref:Uncharacterized protein n=1 Tax=Podospora australis TaxID=1536484 RepID=A0AAN6WJZ0_9PEZI|nr:hypothetical protein QBC35DRAFT_456523 [Podospora australis]
MKIPQFLRRLAGWLYDQPIPIPDLEMGAVVGAGFTPEPGDSLLKAFFIIKDPTTTASLFGRDRLVGVYWRWLEKHLAYTVERVPRFGTWRQGSGAANMTFTYEDFFRSSAVICEAISTPQNDTSLGEVATHLLQSGVLPGGALAWQGDSILQLVFATVGVLSMLYTPSPAIIEGRLAISDSESLRRQGPFTTWCKATCIPLNPDKSICDILRDFSGRRGPISRLKSRLTAP